MKAHTPLTILRWSYNKNLAHEQSHVLSHFLIGKTNIKLFLKVIVRIGAAATLSMG